MWLGLDSLTEVKLKQDVIEVLSFLAIETIREVLLATDISHTFPPPPPPPPPPLTISQLLSFQIIELSLLVKEDMENVFLGPHVSNPCYHRPTLLGPIPPTSQELSPSGTQLVLLYLTYFNTAPNCMPVQWSYIYVYILCTYSHTTL